VHKFARSEFEQPKAGPEGEGQDARSKDAVEAGQVGARWRHQGREFGDEVHRLEVHVRRAVLPRRLQLVTHPTLRRDRQSLLANRRARDVAAQAF